MENKTDQDKKISFDQNANKDVARVGFFVISVVVILYLLTITILPIYAR